jgi:predicted site-specific integrase-resolvase
MRAPTLETEILLTPAELSQMLRVDSKTTTRWAKAGRIHSLRDHGRT